MRKNATRLALVPLVLILKVGLMAQDEDDPLPSDAVEPMLPDPAPNPAIQFPPQTATVGQADPGKALASTAGVAAKGGCSALNPCALPPPSLQGPSSAQK